MFCAFFIPDFRLHAVLRHWPEGWREPMAVVSEAEVLEWTPPAAKAGVMPGMSPAQALARCPSLQICSCAPEAERALGALLLEIATGASAFAEATAANGCTLDLQGCRTGDWTRWGAQLLSRFPPLGLAVRVGIAENPDLALLAAHSATEAEPLRVVDDSLAFLNPLPLEALSPPPKLLAVLRGWGIRNVGGFSKLGRGEVAARLGPEGATLWDRAKGQSKRLLKLVRPTERFEEAFDFEHELETAQPLLFLLRRFVDQLVLRLDALGLVVTELRLALPLADGSWYERIFRIPSPSGDADLLFRVLETHFETLQLELPPTGVRLEAVATKPERRQFQFFENALRDPNRFAETVARLMVIVGNGRVGIPERKPTHRPDQFELRSPDFDAAPSRGEVASVHATGNGTAKIGLPLRRFRPPLLAQVHCEAARPQYVVSDHAHGEVVDWLGPYRLSGEWWEGGWSTEEWDVQMSEGGLYRLSRQGEAWLVEGCYDR